LSKGEWWAPFRTRRIRRAAANALRRLGSPEAHAILEAAAATGSRGVRAAARTALSPIAAATPPEQATTDPGGESPDSDPPPNEPPSERSPL
jgi:HEAT repeat protein